MTGDVVRVLSGGDDHTGGVFDELTGFTPERFVVEPAYTAYTLAGVDAAVPGNHEFDRGTTETPGLAINSPLETVKATRPPLAAKTDVVLRLTHLGYGAGSDDSGKAGAMRRIGAGDSAVSARATAPYRRGRQRRRRPDGPAQARHRVRLSERGRFAKPRGRGHLPRPGDSPGRAPDGGGRVIGPWIVR